MSKTKIYPMDIEWETIRYSFAFPRFYFFICEDCSFCEQFQLQVPFLSFNPDKG